MLKIISSKKLQELEEQKAWLETECEKLRQIIKLNNQKACKVCKHSLEVRGTISNEYICLKHIQCKDYEVKND